MNAKYPMLLQGVTRLLCLTSITVTVAKADSPSFYSKVVPGQAPEYWMETAVHEDQSSSRLLVYQTIPGVKYRVETSGDLLSWEQCSMMDGAGQQELVPMIQWEAPPVPQPPVENPAPQAAPVWLMMQKSSLGGIVLYWHSLDAADGSRLFQNHCFPNLTLDPAWDDAFIYVREFGNYSFLISHPPAVSEAPPDSEHSSADLAMLTAFEENFPTMNGEVINQVASVRLPAQPAPVADPNGKKFFRVWADWSTDSDGDMVPDWEEIAMMHGVAGVGADGTLQTGGTPDPNASPANADTNGNGVPDGEELDFDQDGIPSAMDAAPRDGVIAWTKARPTRYALFDVPLRSYETGDPKWPVDVNSQGMVLFDDGIDWGGNFHALVDPDDGGATQAVAINDHGTILGTAAYHVSDANSYQWGASTWKTPVSKPELVTAGNIEAGTPKNQNGMVSTFSNDGSFMSSAYAVDSGEHLGDYYWNLDANGVYQGTPADGFWYCADDGVRWGWNGACQILVAPTGGGNLGPTDFDRYVVVDGRVPVLMSNRGSQARFYVNNSWKSSPTLTDILDISKTGIARMWKSPAKENIPEELGFWTNGKFLHLKTMVPDLPEIYQDWPRVSIPGMTDQGTFVLRMDSGHPLDPSACAVCLPCAVEDDVSEAARLAYRDHEGDTVPFTGVDDVSITADKTDPSAHNKIWIMAPIGGEAAPNDVKIHIPVSADNPLTLGAANVDGEKTITADGDQISLMGTGVATTDENLTLKLATNTALNAPIGVKAMKRRTVKVTLTPVGLKKEDGSVSYPKRLPTKERMLKYLNKTYLLQMNAEIDLTYKDPVPLRFSTMTQADLNLDPNKPENEKLKVYLPNIDGGTFDYMLNAPGGEQAAFEALRDAGADINVYFVGGIATIVGWHLDDTSAEGYKTWSVGGANGISNRDTNSAWVSDTRFDVYPFDNDPPEEKANYERLQMRTTAHEMGHLIIKYGHPDDGAGAAPLPGTDHNERLMRSGGSKAILRGNRLVKGEWDEAEAWLSKLPDRTGQTQ